MLQGVQNNLSDFISLLEKIKCKILKVGTLTRSISVKWFYV